MLTVLTQLAMSLAAGCAATPILAIHRNTPRPYRMRPATVFSLLVLTACGATAGSTAGSTHPAPARAPNAGFRFPDAAGFTIESAAHGWWTAGYPEYPPDAREAGVQARVVYAVIVDATGQVEYPSATFLFPAPPTFERAICGWLNTAQFSVDGRAPGQRTLIVGAVEFTLGGPNQEPSDPTILGPGPDIKKMVARFRELPRPDLVGQLAREPHC